MKSMIVAILLLCVCITLAQAQEQDKPWNPNIQMVYACVNDLSYLVFNVDGNITVVQEMERLFKWLHGDPVPVGLTPRGCFHGIPNLP